MEEEMLFTTGSSNPNPGATNAVPEISLTKSRGNFCRAGAFVLFFALLIAFQAAQAQTESVLYSFCSKTGCPDGSLPEAGMVFDKRGDLYGTTVTGGASNLGTVFELSTSETEKVLHSFGDTTTDGIEPLAGVVMDKAGNLYGTTPGGGANDNGGTVFKVTSRGVETILYNFCSLSGCKDGFYPQGGLAIDATGNLYGTTVDGGQYGSGSVFEITAAGAFSTLYSFCPQTPCVDGNSPRSGVVIGANGILYGTTNAGGANNFGTVFALSGGAETVLHSFNNNGSDGYYPVASLAIGNKGILYGTTPFGGTAGGGIVFQVTPAGVEKVLHSFTDDPDGYSPQAGLTKNKAGNFYGTTSDGGTDNVGTVFEITTTGTETVLYSFTSTPDGAYPYGGLVLDATGNLYGTTQLGGANDKGTVFKLTP
jgi:uncharacterized repeat protein (TIGR03803 family)